VGIAPRVSYINLVSELPDPIPASVNFLFASYLLFLKAAIKTDPNL